MDQLQDIHILWSSWSPMKPEKGSRSWRSGDSMSRLQTLQTRSTGAMTSVAQKFRGKQAACVGWREEQRIFHSTHDLTKFQFNFKFQLSNLNLSECWATFCFEEEEEVGPRRGPPHITTLRTKDEKLQTNNRRSSDFLF